MRESDLTFAAELTAIENWPSETGEAFANALAYDPSGCLVAEREGRPAGIVVAIAYRRSGFIGELIVRKDARGRGIGPQLFNRAIQHLKERGAGEIGLDAVDRAVPFYESAGFRAVCPSLRFLGKMEGRPHPDVRPMRRQDLADVLRLDRDAFGDDRSFFLERRFSSYPRFAKVLESDGRIAGFILGMQGRNIVGAGPWVAGEDVERPAALLESLAAETADLPIRIGVLESNVRAVAALRDSPGLAAVHASRRMILGSGGPDARLGHSRLCWAVGSPAKG